MHEIRRFSNETIKKLAIRIETLVRKAHSLNTHGYKNTTMKKINKKEHHIHLQFENLI